MPVSAYTEAIPVIITDGVDLDTPISGGGGGGGDASAANQTTEITKLTSIDGKVPALGQALKAASLAVVPASDWTVPAAEVRTATLQNAAAATGNGTAIDISGMATLLLGITISATATVTAEASLDSTNGTDGTWFTLTTGENMASGALIAGVSSSSVNARYAVTGLKMVRARISAFTSGTVTVIGRAQANEGPLPQTNVALYGAGSTTSINVAAPGDTVASNTGLFGVSQGVAFNGATWDRQRNNSDLTILNTTARTVLTNSPDVVNYNARAVRIDIDVTAVAGSPSLVFKVQTKDTLSGVYVDVLTAVAITAAGHVQLLVGNGVTAVANLAANTVLGRIWRVVCTPGTADSCTYSVSASSNN